MGISLHLIFQSSPYHKGESNFQNGDDFISVFKSSSYPMGLNQPCQKDETPVYGTQALKVLEKRLEWFNHVKYVETILPGTLKKMGFCTEITHFNGNFIISSEQPGIKFIEEDIKAISEAIKIYKKLTKKKIKCWITEG